MTADDAIRRAVRYLETADLVDEDGDPEICVFRAYYATFYPLRERLQGRRDRHASRTHQSVWPSL